MSSLVQRIALPDEIFHDVKTELAKLPQSEPVTEHHFADGMCMRTVFRTAGTLVVGKVHKKEHFFALIDGEMTVWMNDTKTRAKAPFVWSCPIGTKRITFAHTDATAMTVHQVSSHDVQEIEDELVEDDPASMFGAGNQLLPPPIEVEK